MAELERELRAVRIEWPEAPELVGRVRPRLVEPTRGFAWRRPLIVALAVLAVAIGLAFAVPPARTAILRWLGLTHVRIVRVEHLPPTRKVSIADLGRPMTLREARRVLPFAPLVLRERPDRIFVFRGLGGTRVTFVYGDVDRPRLTLSEFRGIGVTKFVEKLVGSGTKVEEVEVDSSAGLWLSGKPHAVYYALPGASSLVFQSLPILAGNTLVWERPDGLTLRLEGRLSKDDALRLANSLQ
jgi:hypothetical protein